MTKHLNSGLLKVHYSDVSAFRCPLFRSPMHTDNDLNTKHSTTRHVLTIQISSLSRIQIPTVSLSYGFGHTADSLLKK